VDLKDGLDALEEKNKFWPLPVFEVRIVQLLALSVYDDAIGLRNGSSTNEFHRDGKEIAEKGRRKTKFQNFRRAFPLNFQQILR
jgi:hypothetical protein